MTTPNFYNVHGQITSPFEGAMALIAEIIRERPNLDGGLCTGNPTGAHDLVDLATDHPNRLDGREAKRDLRNMCSACPVREQCPDRADKPAPNRKPPRPTRARRHYPPRTCGRGHKVEGPNTLSDGDCRACSRARGWGTRNGITADDPRVLQMSNKHYFDIMQNHLLGGTA